MAPKTRYDREQVLDAAYAVLRRQGIAGVTARAIATELGGSTSPVYSALGSMSDLEQALRVRAIDALADRQVHRRTDNPYLDLAFGYVVFARENPQIYRFLFVDRPVDYAGADGQAWDDAVAARLPEPLPQARFFGTVAVTRGRGIALKSWIFAHGLAMALAMGVMSLDDEAVLRLLREAGGDFLAGEARRDAGGVP